MDFGLLYQLKNNRPQLAQGMFYLAAALMAVCVFSYGIFTAKTYLQGQEIAQLDEKLAEFGTPDQKISEKKVLDYKRQIDDFQRVLQNHRIVTNVFSFLEEHTLPDVWFSSFNIAQERNQIDLLGETKSMESLSNQVNIFETSNENIRSIDLQSAQAIPDGGVRFTMTISLDPNVFTHYQEGDAQINPEGESLPSPTPSTMPGFIQQ